MRQPVRIVAHRNRNGSVSIRLRAAISGSTADITAGITVDPDDWDARRLRVKASNPDHAQLNAHIDALADAIRAELARNPHATAQSLRETIKCPQIERKPLSDDFFENYDHFCAVESVRNNWTDGTRRNYDCLRSILVRFNPLLQLSTLNAATLDAFVASLVAKGRNNTTIARMLRRLLGFLRWANTQGYYDGTLHNTYRPRLTGAHFETKQIIYLTPDELNAIESVELPEYLAITRDIFVFCCYTGLRISDALRLRNIDIADGTHINIVTRKTADSLRIEFNRHSSAIAARYYRENSPSDALFGLSYSIETINFHLRAIGQICRIDTPIHLTHFSGARRIEEIKPKWQLLTTHVARRTFVVNALRLGIPAEVITRWTGHSTLDAMRPYMAIVDELKAANMARFNDI